MDNIIDNSDNEQIVDILGDNQKQFYESTSNDDELLKFIVRHIDQWRDYRDQNFTDN